MLPETRVQKTPKKKLFSYPKVSHQGPSENKLFTSAKVFSGDFIIREELARNGKRLHFNNFGKCALTGRWLRVSQQKRAQDFVSWVLVVLDASLLHNRKPQGCCRLESWALCHGVTDSHEVPQTRHQLRRVNLPVLRQGFGVANESFLVKLPILPKQVIRQNQWRLTKPRSNVRQALFRKVLRIYRNSQTWWQMNGGMVAWWHGVTKKKLAGLDNSESCFDFVTVSQVIDWNPNLPLHPLTGDSVLNEQLFVPVCPVVFTASL